MENSSETKIKQMCASIFLHFSKFFTPKSKLDLTHVPAQQENRSCDHSPQLGVVRNEWIYKSTSSIRLRVMVFI